MPRRPVCIDGLILPYSPAAQESCFSIDVDNQDLVGLRVMPRRAPRIQVLAFFLLLGACSDKPAASDKPASDKPSTAGSPSPKVSSIPSVTVAARAPEADSKRAKIEAKKFVRDRPDSIDRTGVDACAYVGGFGFGCLDALLAEKNPMLKRYMRRLSDADARRAFDQWQAKDPAGVPHAEFADQCADKGPCGGVAGKSDDGYACLTRAESAIQQNAEAESKAAHERACKCGTERAQIPIMGGFLACQGTTPERRGQQLTTSEANEIRACAECDPENGPAACGKEIERLSKNDPELAKYIETIHVPRCEKP